MNTTHADVARTPDDNTIKSWIASLELKAEEERAAMNYDHATTFCFDCPHRWVSDDLDYVAQRCCKDDDRFYSEDQQEAQKRFFANIAAAKLALKALLSGE